LSFQADRPHRLARLGRLVFDIEITDDMQAADATIAALVNWFKEIGTYDTLKNVGVKKEDLKMMADETIRVGGLGKNTLAGTHPLTSDDIFRIYTAVYE
jgi:butanol dehydrogenase